MGAGAAHRPPPFRLSKDGENVRSRPSIPRIAAAAIVLVGLGALAPVALESRGDRLQVAGAASSDVLLPVASDADAAIAALGERTEARPDDAKLHAQLGLAYLGRARDAADPSSLLPAEAAFRRSLELQDVGNLEAYVGMAALSNARHDFSASVEWSRKAIATNPHSSSAYGLLGDALFELGKVARADAAYQRMVDLRPDVASYVRASYAQQYHGRTRAATATLRLALRAAGPAGETAAWVRHQLGDVYAGLGDHAEAARQNRIGTRIAPGYVPPTVGLAEAHMARGRLDSALPIMEVAARELPALEYMITLGDLYHATGRPSEAEEQYALVAEKLARYRAAGVKADADFTVFYADHGLRADAAVREARRAYAERPTQKIADALGWALHARGDHRAAWRYARRAVRGPVQDATAYFHAGAIADALGRDGVARRLARRALDLDPAFSLVHAAAARSLAGAEAGASSK